MANDERREAVKTEVALQLVQLAAAAAMVVVGVALQVAQRRASEPDFIRTAGMRWAKAAERGWARLAAVAWQRAETARLDYEGARDGNPA